MKKCPRCKKEIRDNEKFCHHCGFDMRRSQAKSHNKKMMLFFLVPFLVIAGTGYFMRYFDNIARELGQIGKVELELLEVAEYAPTYITKTFYSLEEFDNQFSNVDSVVEGILEFKDTLSKDGLYEVVSSYKIELLDNFNVYYHLYYDIQINDHLTLNVYKTFDRLNLVNDEVYTFKTANTNEFNDLLLNEEELDAVTSFVKGKEVTTRLVNEFKDRNDEFEYKKDSLGHYGIGNYEGSYSFVVYKDNDSYYSKLKYTSVAKELIK